jgi:hypothetical protein
MCIRENSKRASAGLEAEPYNVTDASNRKDMDRIAIAFTIPEGSSRHGTRNPITPDQTGQPGVFLFLILFDLLRCMRLAIERYVKCRRANIR